MSEKKKLLQRGKKKKKKSFNIIHENYSILVLGKESKRIVYNEYFAIWSYVRLCQRIGLRKFYDF